VAGTLAAVDVKDLARHERFDELHKLAAAGLSDGRPGSC